MAGATNILFIQADQQRRDLTGFHGSGLVQTPNIDRLAAAGTVFEDAYTVSPICAPARASMLTGIYPARHGVLRNPESGEPSGMDFVPGVETFGTMLRGAGYDVYHVGKWHVGRTLTPQDCGFRGVYHPGYGYPGKHPDYLGYLESIGVEARRIGDEFHSHYPDGSEGQLLAAVQQGPEEAAVPHYLAARVIEDIDSAAAGDRPFFIRMDFWGPHAPYVIPERYMRMYDPAEIPPWPNQDDPLEGKPSIQRLMRGYWGADGFTREDWARIVAACCGYTTLIDDAVGRVMAHLEDAGLADSTAVFYTSDHGGMVGGHGLMDKGPYLYQEICRVPMFIRMPGRPGGRRVGGFVLNMDFMPTFLETAGAAVPAGLDARSLMPALVGDSWRGRDDVYIEFHGHQCPYETRALVKGGWKYVFNGPDVDELYDLESDPGELVNLIGSTEAAARTAEMRKIILERIRGLGDPIRRYFVNTRMKG